MRLLTLVLAALMILMQYDLWFGKNSLTDYFQVQQEVAQQQLQNQKLVQRNRILKAEISDLRDGNAAIEEHARNELGMIRKGETFYRFIPDKQTYEE
ncbi:MAG: Cell division protein FtsB [Candidatus Celerinatantimonas neptuna]|nr:MAG: Cell division protein FtsB [Candidatus Celerinatantimonas neptuna]